MLFDDQFRVQPYKLAHVPVSERILSSEDGSDFKYFLEITHHAHLFVELGGLGEAGIFTKILEAEHVGAAL